MKIRRVILIAFLINSKTMLLNAQTKYVSIPDRNFERVLVEKRFDTDKLINGRIKLSDALKIDSLDVGYSEISDLQGIQFFTHLRYLICSGNNIKYIDIAKNTNLLGLVCDNNQITHLDVTKNTCLEILECRINPLNELDVSFNHNLKILSCQENNLTTIDLSKNINLLYFRCRDNKLKNISFENNLLLLAINCSNNLIEDINISNLPNLMNLQCRKNRLSKLDASMNQKLIVLDCYENLLSELIINTDNLKKFYCEKNKDLTKICINKEIDNSKCIEFEIESFTKLELCTLKVPSK